MIALRAVSVTALVLAGAALRAQDVVRPSVNELNRYRYRLLGVFDRDSGDPVDGAEVVDILSGTKTATGKSGTVSLFFLPDGGSIVRIRKVGYEMQTMPVSITAADTLPVTVVLTRARELPRVTVTEQTKPIAGDLQEFEERANTKSGGIFIRETEFRQNDNKSLAQLVPGRIPSLMTIPKDKNGMETYFVSTRQECSGPAFQSRCTGSHCAVEIYIDGNKMPEKTDVSRLRTEEFAAAEFYAGGASLPMKFVHTGSNCGVLLLWTRER